MSFIWLSVIRKNTPPEIISVISKEMDSQAQCKESEFEGPYQALDSPFREEVSIIARESFSQKETKKRTSLATNRQICYLDDPQIISATQEIKHENRQYQAWIKNIKTVLQNMQKPELKKISDYQKEWESSIESILKELSIENAGLLKECIKEIQCLEDLLKKIQEEKEEMTDAIDSFNQSLEVQSIKRYSFSSSTETIMPEEPSVKYVRRISEESGYYGSQRSIYSSTETIVPEESESVVMQINPQITKLEKKNEIYKEWISSLERKLKSNLTLNFIKKYKAPNLKMLEDLKAPSFKNVELKQKNRKNEEIIPSLEAQIIENIEINAAYQDLLSEEIYLYQLDKLEKRLDNEQEKFEDMDSYFKKLHEKESQLHANIETFTKCLVQTKKLTSLAIN